MTTSTRMSTSAVLMGGLAVTFMVGSFVNTWTSTLETSVRMRESSPDVPARMSGMTHKT